MGSTVQQILNSSRLFLGLMGLLILTSFIITLVQAHQTGRGLGINDTRIESPARARLYQEDHAPRP
jgi:hypothetical protein